MELIKYFVSSKISVLIFDFATALEIRKAKSLFISRQLEWKPIWLTYDKSNDVIDLFDLIRLQIEMSPSFVIYN